MRQSPCKTTFDKTVDIVIAAALEKAKNGVVSIDELKEIKQLLTIDNVEVDNFCDAINKRCLQKHKLDLIVPARTNAFGRIMVQPVEKLFCIKNSNISNKQLPNFFKVIEQLLGRHTFEEYHDKIADRMRRQSTKFGPDFDWDKFSEDPVVTEVRINTLALIARSFSNFENRLTWFQEAMESDPEGEKKAGTLQFTRRQAKTFLLALFSEFQDTSRSKADINQEHLSEKERKAVSNLIIELKRMK